MRRQLSAGLSIVVVASVIACSGDNRDPIAPSIPTQSVGARRAVNGLVLQENLMEQVHARVIRAVAMALADDQVRASVYNAIRTSSYRENKLHFKAFLAAAGGNLLARAKRGEPGFVAALDSLVDLEFYMPVHAHKGLWTGGTNVIVAGVLRDDGRLPVGFDLNGQQVPIQSAYDPPATPTLALVPVETDFSASSNEAAATTPIGSGAASMLTDPPGVYLTSATIDGTYEGFLMGDPEFEVHAFLAQGTAFTDVSCAGADRNGTLFYWDYNNPPLTWYGNTMIATEAAVSFGQAEYQIWEDDTGPCNNAGGGRPPDTDLVTKNNIAAVSAAISWYFIDPKDNFFKKVAKVLAGVPIVLNFGGVIQDDDLVGIISGPDLGCFPSSGPAQFTLTRGAANAGTVMLDYKMGDKRSPLCAPQPAPLADGSVTVAGRSTVKPSVNCVYSASASGGTAPYVFEWYRNGIWVASGADAIIQTLAANFTVQTIATDATGRIGYSTPKTVVVSSSAPVCPQ